MKQPVIVGIGELLWDMLPDGKQPGGAPANFAYHTGKLGAKAYIVSAVGDDALGLELVEKLKSNGINTDYIGKVTSYPTGQVNVKIDDGGSPSYTIRENSACDNIPFLPEMAELTRSCDAVCFGSLAHRSGQSSNTIIQFLDNTKADCIKIFDVNLRQTYYSKETMKKLLPLSDVVKVNEDEAIIIADFFGLSHKTEIFAGEMLEKFSLQLMIITKGGDESILRSNDEISLLAPPSTTVKDSIGAGDSFTAAVAVGWLYGLPLKTIHQNAAKLSAFVCTQKGAMPDYSGMESVMAGFPSL